MAATTYQLRSYTLEVGPTSTPTLIAAASNSRRGLLISGLGANAGDVAAIGPIIGLDADTTTATGIILDPSAGPLELCEAQHGELVRVPLYAVGSAADFRLTVIEFTSTDRMGGAR
jgi:hypothetical protein